METNLNEILKQVRRIEIRTRRLSSDALDGRFRSVFRGRGMDFDEVREYVPGDEIRSIDWNVTARAGRPFVKKYREERELTIVLVVDVSGSGDFGSGKRTKREIEAEIACVLALSAVKNSDRVGLLLFSDRVERYLPPRKGRIHALRLVREILTCQPESRRTDLGQALDFLDSVTRRRAIVFTISDFQGAEPLALRQSLRKLRRRHDVLALQIHDPRERALPEVGLLTLEDAETGELVEIDTGSQRVRQKFADEARERSELLRRALRGESIDGIQIDASVPYLPSLIQLLRGRGARR
jgi:uncharacterized protein (DUF58 family)